MTLPDGTMEPFVTWRMLALDSGFSYAWELDAKKLKFYPEVRAWCAEDKCQHYNRTWACPPATGDLSVGEQKAAAYSKGILVQTVREVQDFSDRAGILAIAAIHTRSFERLNRKLRERRPGLFAMGMGGCERCEKCTWPDAPCRFPELTAPSMEAWGLMVSEVCTDCGAQYSYGPNTIMFASCFLLE